MPSDSYPSSPRSLKKKQQQPGTELSPGSPDPTSGGSSERAKRRSDESSIGHPAMQIPYQPKRHYRGWRVTARRTLGKHRGVQLTPPISSLSLSELNLARISENPKFRHDLIFNSKLNFVRKSDGRRAREKREMAARYWRMVWKECESTLALLENRGQGLSLTTGNSCFPVMFETIRDILLAIVPARNAAEVEATLNPALWIQQLKDNAWDCKGASRALVGMLKKHCAPRRDPLADRIGDGVTRGIDDRNVSVLVEALQLIFSLLEIMKLVWYYLLSANCGFC